MFRTLLNQSELGNRYNTENKTKTTKMVNRFVSSVVISVLSLLVAIDAQIPIGGLEEITPFEFGRMTAGVNPSQQARGIGMTAGIRPFNAVPNQFVQRGLIRRPGQMQIRFNSGIPPVFPFNRNVLGRRGLPGNPGSVIAPSFNRNGMRIVPMGNNIRTLRQRQLQQEALRRAQIAQRFRPFFNATPPRVGVATIQQAAAIQQIRAQPNFQRSLPVDLSSFPNFGTLRGNEVGNQLINQLISFQQVFPDGLGQRPVAAQQQAVPRVMPALMPADQQILNNMLNQPQTQISEPRGQFFNGQAMGSVPNLQRVTGNNAVLPQLANNLPTPQLPLAPTQGSPAENVVPGSNQPQWSFQTDNTQSLMGGQDSQTSTQTGSVENNPVFTDQSGQGFTEQGFVDQTAAPQSTQTTNDNSPVEFDEQITIFHPGNQELCYRGRNLSPDLLKWIVNILTLRIQRPDGDTLCRNRDSYTISELVEMEKEFLSSGINPHNPNAFQVQPDIVDLDNTGMATGTAAASNQGSNPGLPVPPADALVAMGASSRGIQRRA